MNKTKTKSVTKLIHHHHWQCARCGTRLSKRFEECCEDEECIAHKCSCGGRMFYLGSGQTFEVVNVKS